VVANSFVVNQMSSRGVPDSAMKSLIARPQSASFSYHSAPLRSRSRRGGVGA